MDTSEYLSIIIIVFAAALLFVLMKKTDLLKDDSTCTDNKPYSLAKTQLAFWTLIVFSSFVYLIGKIDFVIDSGFTFNETALLLLGISGATTVLGKTIDTSDQQKVNSGTAAGNTTTPRHQDDCSEGFFIDILSDANGISIHRFQNVIFTVALMAAFPVYVCSEGSMPEWNNTLMTLMGISSAGYLGVKVNENG